MRYLYQIVILLLIFGFSFCKSKKKEEINPEIIAEETIPVSSEIKAWSLFKPGTYWIYKDSISGREDSVYVTSITNDNVIYNLSNKKITEERIIVNLQFDSTYFYTKYILSSYPYDRIIGANATISTWQIFRADSTKLDSPKGIVQNYMIAQLNVPAGNFDSLRYVKYDYVFYYPSHPPYPFIEINHWKYRIGMVKRKSLIHPINQMLVRYNIVQ